jgi:hypothetical protein
MGLLAQQMRDDELILLCPVLHEDPVVLAPVKDKASGWRCRATL